MMPDDDPEIPAYVVEQIAQANRESPGAVALFVVAENFFVAYFDDVDRLRRVFGSGLSLSRDGNYAGVPPEIGLDEATRRIRDAGLDVVLVRRRCRRCGKELGWHDMQSECDHAPDR